LVDRRAVLGIYYGGYLAALLSVVLRNPATAHSLHHGVG
jgi:hypothetical protein